MERPEFLPQDAQYRSTWAGVELWQGQRGIYGVVREAAGPRPALTAEQNKAMAEAGIIGYPWQGN